MGSASRATRLQVFHRITDILRRRHLSMKELQAEIGDISERTIYRYICDLEEFGVSVERDFAGQLFIASDACPFCGKGVSNV